MQLKKEANYTFSAVFLGLFLISASFVGSIPYAFADDDIDDLKAKVQEILGDKKCIKKKKYGDVCDLKRPKVDIVFPEKRDRVPAGDITISGTATDEISGVKKVEVKINKKKFAEATLSGENWEFETELDPGFYFVIVKATDFVGNKGFAITWFFVEP